MKIKITEIFLFTIVILLLVYISKHKDNYSSNTSGITNIDSSFTEKIKELDSIIVYKSKQIEVYKSKYINLLNERKSIQTKKNESLQMLIADTSINEMVNNLNNYIDDSIFMQKDSMICFNKSSYIDVITKFVNEKYLHFELSLCDSQLVIQDSIISSIEQKYISADEKFTTCMKSLNNISNINRDLNLKLTTANNKIKKKNKYIFTLVTIGVLEAVLLYLN